jgi:hypothetical protein
MEFIRRIFYFFTPYTDASERTVARFFKGLTERNNGQKTKTKLNVLLQQDIATINLWTEYRYKGYKYLDKGERKKLYTNLQLIATGFDRFYTNNTPLVDTVIARIQQLAPQATPDPDRAVLLQALTDYFSPHRGTYEYRESSSFGRLLRNPSHEKLVGDCNQIVTLYIYLYSRYYDTQDLRVRILPGHVALHYNGIDIETTNSTFKNYSHETETEILPLEEIVSINLLDTTDMYLATHEVAAEDLLQASRLAFILSHNRDLVTRNLKAAYTKLVKSLMERNNYSQALKIAKTSQDMTLLHAVGTNGAIYEIEHHNYAAARRFAQHSLKNDELTQGSWKAEGSHHYQAHRYHDAIKAFEHVGDQTRVHQCYEALFFEEQKKLGSNLTTESIKKYAGIIKRMRTYAKKSDNKKLIEHANNLNKYL